MTNPYLLETKDLCLKFGKTQGRNKGATEKGWRSLKGE